MKEVEAVGVVAMVAKNTILMGSAQPTILISGNAAPSALLAFRFFENKREFNYLLDGEEVMDG